MSDLYNRIDNLCEKKGVNITKMCKEAEVPRGNLTDLKMGRQMGLSAKNIAKIANYLGVTADYLISGLQSQSTISLANGIVVHRASSHDEIQCSDKKEVNMDIERLSETQLANVPVISSKESHIHVLRGLISYHERMTMGTYPERDFYLDTLRYALKAVEEKIERDAQ